MLPLQRANAAQQRADPVAPPPPTVAGGSATMSQPQQPLSTIQRIVRLAEKDDILLYITALFGIFMPAVMYLFYRTMHSKYHAYQRKKRIAEQKKIARKRNKHSLTILYCGTGNSAKRMAYDLAEELDRFDPIVSNLSAVDINRLLKESAKVMFIFLVHMESNGDPPPVLTAFLDWLDEIRYERRQKSFLAGVTYAIFGVESSDQSREETSSPRVVDIVHNKLQSMKGIPMYRSPTSVPSGGAAESLRSFSADLTRLLKQFHYGAFDDRLADGSEAGDSAASDEDLGPGTIDDSLSTDSEK